MDSYIAYRVADSGARGTGFGFAAFILALICLALVVIFVPIAIVYATVRGIRLLLIRGGSIQ